MAFKLKTKFFGVMDQGQHFRSIYLKQDPVFPYWLIFKHEPKTIYHPLFEIIVSPIWGISENFQHELEKSFSFFFLTDHSRCRGLLSTTNRRLEIALIRGNPDLWRNPMHRSPSAMGVVRVSAVKTAYDQINNQNT